ncbi:MAG TPA: methylmalonyl Co-A mutase-associated GTPase MeaB [Nitrospiraceae bacterium]|nr:methylmalonyl Co-A mutase-associated GTPase MeaB [Nitrospiraceae bacterium]
MDILALAEEVKRGDVRAVSRLITLLENQDPSGKLALQRLEASPGHAAIIGITGYPGAGKSTLIDQLATAYRRQGKKVGILAVDTSSPITGGALLGDRIRMQDHAGDTGVYIRSMATRGQHGGLAGSTRDAVQVLNAAGYDVILVETVGVGQDEVDVAKVAHTLVAAVAPGLGDEVQAMKAGLFEVAHIVAVNKGDREGADMTLHDLKEWVPRVIRTVAVKGEGIPELLEAIAEHQRIVDLQDNSSPLPR